MNTTCPLSFAREMRQKYDDPYSAAVGCGFVVEMGDAACFDKRSGRIVICAQDSCLQQDWSCALMLGRMLFDEKAKAFALEFCAPAKSLLGSGNLSRNALELKFSVPTDILFGHLQACRVKINDVAWQHGNWPISGKPVDLGIEVEEWITTPIAAKMRPDLSWGMNDSAPTSIDRFTRRDRRCV